MMIAGSCPTQKNLNGSIIKFPLPASSHPSLFSFSLIFS